MNISYPDNLPILEHKDTIIETLRNHQLVVIAGDTGSGKTTQLPKMGLEAFPDNDLLIGCTQPRRIAATSVSARVAEELGSFGDRVGYKIRFHDYTTPTTKIKFMTDGVLLAETRQDRLLSRYGLLIIDEAHERSLNIDFLLGYIKQLLPRRPDLKVIITSATIDTQAFSKHFADAPVITIAGRSYPVTVRYCPPKDETGEKESELDHCVKTVCELYDNERKGDILVFLPTERDIRECCLLLEKKIPDAVVLPLYGRLPTSDQRRIFQTFKQLKIVVATNVAETSVTVPGIRYVVDSGLARISQYNVRAKTTSLPITRISRASCDQRKGRCGRIGPGLCIRLYSEEEYHDRPGYTLPELQRANLAEVILQMISLNLGRPEKFPFIDPPYKNAIKEGYQLLRELGAINDTMHLTARGRIMADLPIDPCISRIIIEAKDNNCLKEMKIISAVLAIQDPRIRPLDHEKEADEAHKVFTHPQSDFMILLNIWNGFHDVQEKVISWSRLKKYCKSHFLSFQRMREWIDLHDQLDRILEKREGFVENSTGASYEQIHTALLAGFLRNIATKKQGKIYQGAHNRELMIFPGSHQSMKGGQWLVAASFIETSRLYALTVATIEPEWLERVAGHLCKFSWSNPHWQKKTGQVIADETVSLFGLIIETGRKVNFGRRSVKNIAEARDLFIQSALVLGEMNGTYSFLARNLALIKTWQEAEEKLRERTIIAEDQVFYDFYARRIPEDVYDQQTFNRFLRGKKNQTFLQMSDEDILKRRPGDKELLDYPPVMNVGRMQVRLEYHFEPGSEKDGVTFRLPVDAAASFAPGIFEWLVPGLLQEKLTFLLKALPKSIRKKLVPINETVNRLLDDMPDRNGSLYSAIEASILKHFKILIQRSDWTDTLPLHLQPRFLLFDDAGNEICAGRNVKELFASGQGDRVIKRVEPTLQKKGLEVVERWQGTEHAVWDFAGLPMTIPAFTQHGEVAGFLYPVLLVQPEKGKVKIDFGKNPKTAKELNIAGMVYLYRLQFPEQFKNLKKFCTTSFSGPSAVWLLDLGMTRKEAVDTLLDFFLVRIFGPLSGIVSEETFIATVNRIKKEGLYALGRKMCEDVMILFRKRRTVHDTIRKIFSSGNKNRLGIPDKEQCFQNHLNDIFPVEMFSGTLPVDFGDIDRQLQSLALRLERFYANPGKDRHKEEQLIPHLDNLETLMAKKEEFSKEGLEAALLYREMINDYKIALFSPEIKTPRTVSVQKLHQQWRSTLLKC
ncbi:MAG: ATP-dependent helicase HrpA [Desulfobulbaceae bacterium BRH_c16a]|nr:MAG: ATP-dependent helicase HrpA [Desulfobulbaceae bacterium BRH_c16a]